MILAEVNKKIIVNMKERNSFVVTALKGLKAELENNSKVANSKSELDIVIIYKNKLIKSMEAYSGMIDKQDSIQKEIDLVQEFLPKQMSTESVDSLIKEVILGLGEKKNMGEIMKAVSPITRGKFDGKLLSDRVKLALIN